PGAPVAQLPEPPPVQAPAPGQQSLPMMQPPPVDDSLQGAPDISQSPPEPPGLPPRVPQPPQAVQGPGLQQPPIPPYKTLGGPPMGPQGPMQGVSIPPPPQMGPAPNSMSLQDAAQFIKSRGISDPVTGLQVLDRLNPYLNQEAKHELASTKLQLEFEQKKNA